MEQPGLRSSQQSYLNWRRRLVHNGEVAGEGGNRRGGKRTTVVWGEVPQSLQRIRQASPRGRILGWMAPCRRRRLRCLEMEVAVELSDRGRRDPYRGRPRVLRRRWWKLLRAGRRQWREALESATRWGDCRRSDYL